MEIWRSGNIIGKEAAEVWTGKGLNLTHGKTPMGRESKYWHFEILESDPLWTELQLFLNKKQPDDSHTSIVTVFTDEEQFTAGWCIAREEYSIGCFIPEGEWWTPIYYTDICSTCGTGWRQTSPFRIAKEPKLEGKVFAGFGNAFQLFTTPEVLKAFEQHGIGGFETWPLILDKGDYPASRLKQIVVTEIAKPAIVEELVEHERYYDADCPVCRRTWHLHYTRGMLPLRKSALNPKADFQLTNEWFGNGRTARREILVSQRVVKLVLEQNWQGIYFVPIQAV